MRAIRRVFSVLSRHRSRLVFRLLQLLYLGLMLVPRRLAFFVLTLFQVARLPGKSVLAQAFTPLVVRSLDHNPKFRFSSRASRRLPESEIRTLHRIGAHRELVELLSERGAAATSRGLAILMARSLFELGDFERARGVLEMMFSRAQLVQNPEVAHFRGLLDVVCGDPVKAAADLEIASQGTPHVARPHHNIAARYPHRYQPNRLDRLAGALGRLYDAANYIGQRVTHVGRGELGAGIYRLALEAQKSLDAQIAPPLSEGLLELLDKRGIAYERLKIIPEEWCTQIGHLGMLDMLFRLRTIGWWSGEALVTAEPGIVANYSFLRLFEREGAIVLRRHEIQEAVAGELASLQRWKGLTFNAFELPDGTVVPWQDAGAMMLQQWEREGRGFPLRNEFDRVFGTTGMLDEAVQSIKSRWGMKPGDWYVCLHMRDAAHYNELAGTGQSHRNASVKSYIDAIRHITALGGWVIKLGGPNSPKLPRMTRVFDYARSDMRSDILDLHLIRNARCFIGTTSGLTNVAVSFGVPCALVNCITTDAQLWNSRVRFCLKQIKRHDGGWIDQHQLTASPWRWRVFSAELLGRYGARIVNNSADEILETVKETLALANGTTDEYLKSFAGADDLIAQWRQSLSVPYFYGAAQPSVYPLTKHSSDLGPHTSDRNGNQLGFIGPKSDGEIAGPTAQAKGRRTLPTAVVNASPVTEARGSRGVWAKRG